MMQNYILHIAICIFTKKKKKLSPELPFDFLIFDFLFIAFPERKCLLAPSIVRARSTFGWV